MQLFCKIIGAALLLITGAVLGWRKGDQFMIRAALLGDMVLFLRMVQNNIRYRRDTTESILRDAAKECRTQYLCFVLDCAAPQQLPQALQSALARIQADVSTYVLPQEMQQFARALLTLGGGSAQEETQKLSFTIATLQNAAEEADIPIVRYSLRCTFACFSASSAAFCSVAMVQRKLYRTMGMSGGAAAALLFL